MQKLGISRLDEHRVGLDEHRTLEVLDATGNEGFPAFDFAQFCFDHDELVRHRWRAVVQGERRCHAYLLGQIADSLNNNGISGTRAR